MKNRGVGLLLCFLFYFVGYPQQKLYTDIQKNKKVYPGKPYSIEKVIDARLNKDNIGVVYKTSLDHSYFADLREPLDVALMRFLKTTFPDGSPLVKLTLVINSFEIGHKLSGRIKDTGFVKVNFDFYKEVGDHETLIYNYTGSVVDVNDNIALSHSNRIKRAILLSLSDLDSVIINGTTLTRVIKNDNVILKADSTKINFSGVTKEGIENIEADIARNDYPRRIIFMVGGDVTFSQYSLMYGGNFNVLFRFKNHPRSLLGFNLNYSQIKFTDAPSIPNNTSYNLKTSDFGLRYMRQIKNALFYSFNPHLMVGKETYDTYGTNAVNISNAGINTTVYNSTTVETIFVGGQFDNGIYFLFPKKAGAYFGTDLVIRLTNSSVFDTDVGIKFNLGLAF
jgi:hypothetical protein